MLPFREGVRLFERQKNQGKLTGTHGGGAPSSIAGTVTVPWHDVGDKHGADIQEVRDGSFQTDVDSTLAV